ncbi:phosphatase PAP2 family protein [Chitinophaga sp. sic0106]|uniref:phosphatase PAP2 family protein n=1 Tax=Chitinophaga sp. sic0106 TaxID=2854785 RepID=UPI001C45C5E2|nr:phosphatase PAP2 family protein [Chitinophaga sp. sic0106]MBV7530010.1 phosphatase PAP2 family protein [Chitinophaga sp. sic0106]
MKKLAKVYKGLQLYLWCYLPFFAGLMLVKLLFSRDDIYFFINGLHTPFGDWFFPLVTHLGSVAAAVVFTVLVFFFSKREGFILAGAYCFTALVNFMLKFWVAFPRPHRYFSRKIAEAINDPRLHGIYYVPGVDVLDNFRSFPSGHTVCAFTAATVLAYFTKRKAWSLLYLAIAILVGYSRMYMSQHFFEDVAIGSLVGIVLTIAWLALTDGKGFDANTVKV